MAYREVMMLEVKEVLRLWLAGIPKRRIAAQLGLDVKTVRRYLAAAQASGLAREQGVEALDDVLVASVLAAVRPLLGRPHGEGWALCESQRALIEHYLDEHVRLSKIGKLLARRGTPVAYPPATRHRAAACISPQSYSGLAAGSRSFTVTAMDPAGNVSAPASFTWTITAATPIQRRPRPPRSWSPREVARPTSFRPVVARGGTRESSLTASSACPSAPMASRSARPSAPRSHPEPTTSRPAIDSCPAGQVVQLGAGVFSVTSTVTLTKGIVLRGAGYQGGLAGGTTIVKVGGGTVIAIGTGRDSTCYGRTAYGLTADGAKESTTLSVGSAAANFAAGDLALVDVVDDSTV